MECIGICEGICWLIGILVLKYVVDEEIDDYGW